MGDQGFKSKRILQDRENIEEDDTLRDTTIRQIARIGRKNQPP